MGLGFRVWDLRVQTVIGVWIRGTLGDIDLLNKVPLKRAIIRVKKAPL